MTENKSLSRGTANTQISTCNNQSKEYNSLMICWFTFKLLVFCIMT